MRIGDGYARNEVIRVNQSKTARQNVKVVEAVQRPAGRERPVNIVCMTGRIVHWMETVFDYTSAEALSHVNRIEVPSGRDYELLLLRVGTGAKK